MALKAFYLDQAEIPAELASFYIDKDGKFVLDVDGIETHPSVTALKNAHDRSKADNRTLKDRLSTAEARLDGLPEEFNAEEYERLKEAAGDGSKIDERLERQRSDLERRHSEAIKRKDDRLAVLESALKRKTIDDGLTQALVDAGVERKHLALTKAYLAPRVNIVEDEGEFTAEVDTDINPHMPLAEFVKTWASSEEGKQYVAPATGGGASGSGQKITGENPWDQKTRNLTKQQDIIAANPTRARQLAEAAGVKPNW